MLHPRSKRWGFGFRASHNVFGSTFYEQHRGHNKAAVALANKIARTVSAVWRNGSSLNPAPLTK
jgi:hypothetical protein